MPASALTPFETMHDTPRSAGLRIDSAEGALGFCTDLGAVTDEVRSALAGVSAALIEANHDVEMLRDGPYPAAAQAAHTLRARPPLKRGGRGPRRFPRGKRGGDADPRPHQPREQHARPGAERRRRRAQPRGPGGQPALPPAARAAVRGGAGEMPGVSFVFVGKMKEPHFEAPSPNI